MRRAEAAPRWAAGTRVRRASALAVASAAFWPITGWAAAEPATQAASLWWVLPFAGVLLSVALLPLLAPQAWHAHDGKIFAAWGLAFLAPFALVNGAAAAAGVLLHALMAEYLPFIVLLTALFTVSGGIHLRGRFHGTPLLNTTMLAIGAALGSIMGTTGASMLMIRPLLRANERRGDRVHTVVFFIFIVANAGGALTPLGDPPLFVGFLQGVPFDWTIKHLWSEVAAVIAVLLLVYYGIDSRYYRRDLQLKDAPVTEVFRLGIDGLRNVVWLGVIVALVLLSGVWKQAPQVNVAGVHVGLQNVVRDVGLLAVIGLSLRLTSPRIHQVNNFAWGPILEVAKLFAVVFLTIVPVIDLLKAGPQGPFAGLLDLLQHADGRPNTMMYFWITGLLSAFLDNAPTYLVFFNAAGGDVAHLTGDWAPVLAAISAGAVFMGANSYIGNAPNLMVKSMAEDSGVKMPSFMGYLAWSTGVLLPLLVVVSWVWHR